MRVIQAESAGFCYGVERAVKIAEETAREKGGCVMLGSIIHNAHVPDCGPRSTSITLSGKARLPAANSPAPTASASRCWIGLRRSAHSV